MSSIVPSCSPQPTESERLNQEVKNNAARIVWIVPDQEGFLVSVRIVERVRGYDMYTIRQIPGWEAYARTTWSDGDFLAVDDNGDGCIDEFQIFGPTDVVWTNIDVSEKKSQVFAQQCVIELLDMPEVREKIEAAKRKIENHLTKKSI